MKILHNVMSPFFIGEYPSNSDKLSIFDEVQKLPPILNQNMELNRHYPNALMRIVEEALLNKAGIHLDESYFHPIVEALESTLQSLTLDIPKDEFWKKIAAARSQLYTEQEYEYTDYQIEDRGTMSLWCSGVAKNEGIKACGDGDKVKTLKELSINKVVDSIWQCGKFSIQNEIVDSKAGLVFALIQERIGEFTLAAKACRPDLWDIPLIVCEDMEPYINRAIDLCDDIVSDHAINVTKLLHIDRELMWASYYAGVTDCDSSALLSADNIAGIIAIENVRHRVTKTLEKYGYVA